MSNRAASFVEEWVRENAVKPVNDAVAGALPEGAVAHWQVEHSIPIERDEQGQVVVSRSLGGAGFQCKEIVFSVAGEISANGY